MLTVPTWVWVATLLGLLLVIVADLVIGNRDDDEVPTTRSSALGVVLYVGMALAFALGLLIFSGGAASGQFLTGYVLEYSLSVDNLFVYLILMGSFQVPEPQRRSVLLVGIIGTLLLRGPFILAGSAAAQRFTATFYVFGALLLYTAVSLVRSSDDQGDAKENPVVRLARRVLPVTEQFDGHHITTKVDGRRQATPLLLAMIAVSVTGLVFALDSIPAIFGVTKDPYLIVAANAFALMGLRQLYFLVGGLVQRLVHLSVGLAVILGFIGLKLILEAAHGNGFTAIPVPSTSVSLGVIVVILGLTTVLSLRTARAREASDT